MCLFRNNLLQVLFYVTDTPFVEVLGLQNSTFRPQSNIFAGMDTNSEMSGHFLLGKEDETE
jgi:hypothetical protein